MNPIIIIGAGLAAWTTVREFRKLDTTTPILMITADSGDFYAKPTLSNAFAQKKSPEQLVVTPAARMIEAQGVTLLAHTQVLGFDPYVKTVTTSQGSHDFSALVLATGAAAIRIAVAGDAADQVFSVNSLEDFSSFYKVLNIDDIGRNTSHSSYKKNSKNARKVLIMGAGLIGCEFANDLINAGYAVSVVDPSARPLAALLPALAGEQLRDALSELGVAWHFGTAVQAVNKSTETGEEPSLLATLTNGEVLPADVVLSAVGLRADTRLALAAGLLCERGIKVDATLQTSAPLVYALGDVAQYASAGDATLPYVMPIMNAARALAVTLTGKPTEAVFPIMPVAVKTPAMPLLIVSPKIGTPGDWQAVEPGLWQHVGEEGRLQGFILAGAQTSRRAEQVKALQTGMATA